MQRHTISPLDFVIWILGIGAVLTLLANLLSSGFNLHLGLVMFILGFTAMVAGNMLGLPARRYERRCGIRHVNLFQLPSPEEYIGGNILTARHAASFYSFENALLLAGFIILLSGLFILF
jgi:hypothetical protein